MNTVLKDRWKKQLKHMNSDELDFSGVRLLLKGAPSPMLTLPEYLQASADWVFWKVKPTSDVRFSLLTQSDTSVPCFGSSPALRVDFVDPGGS